MICDAGAVLGVESYLICCPIIWVVVHDHWGNRDQFLLQCFLHSGFVWTYIGPDNFAGLKATSASCKYHRLAYQTKWYHIVPVTWYYVWCVQRTGAAPSSIFWCCYSSPGVYSSTSLSLWKLLVRLHVLLILIRWFSHLNMYYPILMYTTNSIK